MPEVSQAFQPTQAQAAIAKIESGGNYGVLGPVTHSGDRAYGKYQVMGSNIPQWSKAALGKEMTPQEFLANPQAQDAVFNHQFGGYVQRDGAANAASEWLTGRRLDQGGATAADQNGTTGAAYAKQFVNNLQGAPTAQAAAHVPTWADVQADNAQGSASIAARTAPLAAMANLAPPAQPAALAPAPAPVAPPAGNPYAALAAALGQASTNVATQTPPQAVGVRQNFAAPMRDPNALARSLTQGLAGNLTLAS